MSQDYKIPECDTFGYCVKCGKKMIGHAVIDGVYKIKLSGDYTDVSYKLNDGSSMRVAMCKGCSDNLTGDKEEHDLIMRKVWRGWQNEVQTFSHWPEQKKIDYLNQYSTRRIVIRDDIIPSDVVEKSLNIYTKENHKPVKHILKEDNNGSIK